MKLDLCHNKMIEASVTEGFCRSVEENLLPRLTAKFGAVSTVQMYEDYIKDGLTLEGVQCYPLTVKVGEDIKTQWIGWEVTSDFEGGVPYAYVGKENINFKMFDSAPYGFEEKIAGRNRYFEDGLIKINVSAPHPDKLFLAGRYSQTFIDEMSRQLTPAIVSAMSLENIGDGVIELSMVFAPETYMEHTSENVTYRRLLLCDKSSAPRDFWIKWTRLGSHQGYSVSDHVSGEDIVFELGEDVSQKIREKEYRFLLRSGKDKYHNSMGRKNITEWRELIKRAIKRGELTRVEIKETLSESDGELERRLASVLGITPGKAAPTEISFADATPEESTESDSGLDEITRLALEALNAVRDNQSAEVVFEDSEVAEDEAEDGEDILDEHEEVSEEENEPDVAEEDGEYIEEPDAELDDTEYAEEDEDELSDADEAVYYGDGDDIVDEETLAESYVDAGGTELTEEEAELDFTEDSETLAEQASLDTDIIDCEDEPAAEEPDGECVASVEEEKPVPVSVNLDNYVTRDELRTGIRAELEAAVRAELEAKIRLEYESEAKARAQREAAELRRECELMKLELEKRELEVRRLEAERAEREEAMVAETERLKAQLEFQLKRDSLERERVAEAARLALEEQKRLAGEKQLVEKMRAEEQERLEREREEARLAEERRREAERLDSINRSNAQPTLAVDPEEAPKPEYTYVSKTVRLLFRRSVDPNVTARIYEIIKATVEYYGKESVYMKIRATVPTSDTVNLEFVRIPKEEMELLSNIIKVLGNSGLGIAKAIVD